MMQPQEEGALVARAAATPALAEGATPLAVEAPDLVEATENLPAVAGMVQEAAQPPPLQEPAAVAEAELEGAAPTPEMDA